MKKTVYFVILLLLSQLTFGQLKVTKLDRSAIPKSIAYKGKIVDAVKYSDIDGEHLVITTETGETLSKNSDGGNFRDAALYAYHYLIQSGNYNLTWQTYDFIKDCPVDIRANYVPKAFAITDLDKNGKAEIWLMYKTICHGDVSPSDMKIIMHEYDKKYAIRGTNRVKISPKEFEGGKYFLDVAFKLGPQIFRGYADSLWRKNLIETWK